jgi:hypothetical protein
VCGKAKQINTCLLDIQRKSVGALDRIGVKWDLSSELVSSIEHCLRNFRDRLDHPDLVVGGHDAHQDGALRDRAGDIIRIDKTIAIDWNIGCFESELLQILTAV